MGMHAQCAECNHHFAIGPNEVVSGACPDCGQAQTFYRLQPTPVQGEMVPFRDGVSDGEKDSGGNPLGEGTIMGKDGERPLGKRDNYMGKVAATQPFDFSGEGPDVTHSFVVAPTGRVYSMPAPATHEQIADAHGLIYHGFPKGMSMGDLHHDGSTNFHIHESGWPPDHLQQVLGDHFQQPVIVDPSLAPASNEQRWAPEAQSEPPRRELETLHGPAGPREWGTPRDSEGLVRGGSRTLNMEPYEDLWGRTSGAAPAVEFAGGPDAPSMPRHTITVTPGPHGVHNRNTKWLRFLDAHIDGMPVRGNEGAVYEKYGMRQSPHFGQPIKLSVHHPSHMPAAIATVQDPSLGGRPTPEMMRVGQAIQAGALPAPPSLNGNILGPLPLEPQIRTAGAAAVVPLAAEGVLDGAAALGVGGAAGDAAAVGAGTDAAMGAMGDAGAGALNAAEDTASAAGKGIGGAARGIWDGAKGLLGDVGGRLGPVAGPLMRGINTGTKILHGAEDLLGIGGGGDQSAPQDLQGQEPLSMGQLSHRLADYETPTSNPSVGTDHDDPEQVDQHEFNDGDDQNNQYNPNLEDSGASGEDDVRQNAGFAPDSPALQRLQMIAPLALHYLHHPHEDASQDPIIRGLHDVLEAENPGYMDGVHEGHVHHLKEALKHHSRQPMGVVAAMAPPGPDPSQGAPPPDMSQGPPPGPPSPPPNPISGGQGPQTPEQIAAVQQWLLKHHRADQVPHVVMDPNNPEFVRILDMIQNQSQISAPEVDPAEVTPPSPPPGGAPGGMPMPDPSGGGGAPMQPMSKVAADSVAKRCKRCGSGTTGLINKEGDSFCHACGAKWRDPMFKEDVIAAVAPTHEDHQQEGHSRLDLEDSQDPGGGSGAFADAQGQPLQEGQEYQMINPSFTIPDTIKVVRVKPDGIVVTIKGVFTNDPSTPQVEDPRPIPLSRDDIETQGLTFEPLGQEDGDADDMSQEPPSGTPGHEQVPPSGQTTDEYDGGGGHMSSVEDDRCRKCGSLSVTSAMSSPTTTVYDCLPCGSSWEVHDDFEGKQSGLDWILDDSGPDDFFEGFERAQAMREAGTASRDIHSIAANDQRSQQIKQTLEQNRHEREARLAGKKFSPREQRELIEEDGFARNHTRLDLAGTHYNLRDSYDSTGVHGRGAEADRVPDSHVMMGL